MLLGRLSHNKRSFYAYIDIKNNVAHEIFAEQSEILKQDLSEIDMDPKAISLSEVGFLPPISPSKIICVGRNYLEHAKEFGNEVPEEPLIFFKPPSALLAHKGKVIYPKMVTRLDFEGEVALVIKQRIKSISKEEIIKDPRTFYGYTPFLDMTARGIQRKDKLWTRGKGFDTFAPLGPYVKLEPFTKDIKLQTYLNGNLKQDSTTDLMIFKPAKLIEYISEVMTLMPGDVIATGTPSGVGTVKVGDKITLRIGNLPQLEVEISKGK